MPHAKSVNSTSRQNKVKNTKVTYNTGKNEVSESLIRRAFEPLFNKDEEARLTFCGVMHSVNNEWDKKINKRIEKPKLVLTFSCLDVTHDNPQNIGIRVDYRVSKNNALGRFLELTGYVFNDTVSIVDEDDEFGKKTEYEDPRKVFDHLREKHGLVFKAGLKKGTATNKDGEKYEKGLWNIKDTTLKPFMKNNEQVRDMLASDVSDEEFENPNVEMVGDSV